MAGLGTPMAAPNHSFGPPDPFVVLHGAVETRLTKIGGQRLARLYTKDLPELARGIIAVIRKRGTIRAHVSRNVPFVRIRSSELDILVMKADWLLILPFIQDGTLNPRVYPRAAHVGYLEFRVAYGEAVQDHADRHLYEVILGLLQQLFTDVFPTSDL